MPYKAQHIIPRSYLSGFVDPATPEGQEPFVWVYERGSGQPFARAPMKLALRSYYYSYTTPGGEKDHGVEEALSRFEGAGIPVLRELAGGRDPSDLTDDERAAFSVFLGFIAVRVPRFRTLVESQAAELIKMVGQVAASDREHFERRIREAMTAAGREIPQDVEAVRQFALSDQYTVEMDPLLSLQTMLRLAPTIATYIFKYEWRVLEAPTGTAFVTSDAPLVQVCTEQLPPPWGWGTGWETPWMEASFPLSPTSCLLISLHHPSGREAISPDIVSEVNLRTAAYADEQVYSSRSIDAVTLNQPPGWKSWKPVTEALNPRRSDADAKSDGRS